MRWGKMKLFDYEVGLDKPLLIIAGPCLAESEQLCQDVSGHMMELTKDLGLPYVFKASYVKANRTSGRSPRETESGDALMWLGKLPCRVITDVHEAVDPVYVSAFVDMLQIPAFLCRQTELIEAAADTKLPIMIKKGQFMSPWDMKYAVEKATDMGNDQVLLCERGTMFGYGNLVVDMRSLIIMRKSRDGETRPVVFDSSHCVQLPGGRDHCSGGQREFIKPLARAAAAMGISGLFIETHPRPEDALSDRETQYPLAQMRELLESVLEVR